MGDGQVVGHYLLGSVLGKGAYGTVYQALDQKVGQFVAVKQVNLKSIPRDQLDATMVNRREITKDGD